MAKRGVIQWFTWKDYALLAGIILFAIVMCIVGFMLRVWFIRWVIWG